MSQTNDSGLGRKLAILAKLKGLTQEQIARECAMSRISVNRFFRQHTEIRAGDLSLLLQTLGINLEQLIDKAIEAQMNGSNSTIDMSASVYRGGACPEVMALPMGLAV